MHEQCSICHQIMREKTQNYQIKECKHLFHLDCIIRWWRSPREKYNSYGTCPLCRALPSIEGEWHDFSRRSRVKVLKQLSKTKKIHKNIKISLDKLENKETELKKIQKKKKIFMEEENTKLVLKKINNFDRKIWKLKQKVQKCIVETSQYDPMSMIDLYVT